MCGRHELRFCPSCSWAPHRRRDGCKVILAHALGNWLVHTFLFAARCYSSLGAWMECPAWARSSHKFQNKLDALTGPFLSSNVQNWCRARADYITRHTCSKTGNSERGTYGEPWEGLATWRPNVTRHWPLPMNSWEQLSNNGLFSLVHFNSNTWEVKNNSVIMGCSH